MSKKSEPRKHSEETLLKRRMRELRKELAKGQKKLDQFNELEAEIAAIREHMDEMEAELDETKKALIKELGLD